MEFRKPLIVSFSLLAFGSASAIAQSQSQQQEQKEQKQQTSKPEERSSAAAGPRSAPRRKRSAPSRM